MFKDVNVIARGLNGVITTADQWKDEVIAAFEDSLEVIISHHENNTYQVYENHQDAPVMWVTLKETVNGDIELITDVE